jgi:hypothetical protein
MLLVVANEVHYTPPHHQSKGTAVFKFKSKTSDIDKKYFKPMIQGFI